MIGIIGCLLGIIIGLNIFKVSEKVINYKCIQLNKERPVGDIISKEIKIIFIIVHILLYTIGFFLIPVPKSIFVALFISISMVITIVDISIHIIPNESVLLLLFIGILYRLAGGGLASLKSAILGLLIISVLFLGTGLIVFLLKGTIGVGAGDLKLAMVISIILGYPGSLYFIVGLSLALLGYIGMKLAFKGPVMGTSFPMAGQIAVGFLIALFYPYLEFLL